MDGAPGLLHLFERGSNIACMCGPRAWIVGKHLLHQGGQGGLCDSVAQTEGCEPLRGRCQVLAGEESMEKHTQAIDVGLRSGLGAAILFRGRVAR
jgi:hypothetical protein